VWILLDDDFRARDLTGKKIHQISGSLGAAPNRGGQWSPAVCASQRGLCRGARGNTSIDAVERCMRTEFKREQVSRGVWVIFLGSMQMR